MPGRGEALSQSSLAATMPDLMEPQKWKATAADANVSLLEFIAGRLDSSRKKAKALIDTRRVFVNGRRTWIARHAVRAGDRIEVQAAPPVSASDPIPVLHEDAYLLVVNKPPGRTVQGPDGVEARLREHCRMPSIQASHRLDRDTSGCLLLSKDPSVHDDLIEQFRRRKVTKTYVAIVYGSVAAPRQSIRDPLDGLSAITHLEVTATGPRATVVRIRIETGRTHQIRRHLASRNHPVLGDKQYGGSRVRDARLRAVSRQLLHAETLRFMHPKTGDVVRAKAPLPGDMRSWQSVLCGNAR